jgi:hypothetical protein
MSGTSGELVTGVDGGAGAVVGEVVGDGSIVAGAVGGGDVVAGAPVVAAPVAADVSPEASPSEPEQLAASATAMNRAVARKERFVVIPMAAHVTSHVRM